MRALMLRTGFGLDQLELAEVDAPRPGPGELLLEMRVASLNHRDLLVVEGKYDPSFPLPLVPASDGVGRVVAVGKGVSSWPLGTRVCPIFAPFWQEGPPDRSTMRETLGGPLDGTLRQYMTAQAESVVVVPDHLSDEQAACLPCAGVTAFSALCELGQLGPGQTVLCLGTGTVCLAALGIAKALGARVCVTSRHDDKLAQVKRLGADFTINTVTTPEWQHEVKRLTGGVDQVIEVTGGATLGRAVRAVKPGGIVNLIGALSGSKTELELLPILMRQVRIQGVYVGPRRAFSNLLELMRRTALQPVVGPVYELSDFRQAFDDLTTQKHLGNVCVRLA